jgi:hypothetical protein
MPVQNLTTACFVLQCLHAELEEYDRDIPVARNIQVGDVTDALAAVLTDRRIRRLTAPARPAPQARRTPTSRSRVVAKRKTRVTRTA